MSGFTLPALLLACSVSNRPPALDTPTLTAIVTTFSMGNPYTVRNVAFSTLNGQDSPLILVRTNSEHSARTAIAQILDADGTPVVGLLPTQLHWAEEYGHSVLKLLNPCTNIRIATAKLTAFAYQCSKAFGRANSATIRRCAIDLYGEALQLPALTQVVLSRLHSNDSARTTSRSKAQ